MRGGGGIKIHDINTLVLPNDPLSIYVKQGNFEQFIDRFKFYADNLGEVYIYNMDRERVDFEYPNLRIINTSKPPWKVIEIFKKIRDLRSLCKEFDIDVLRTLEGASFLKSSIVGIVGKIEKKPTIVSFHGIWNEWLRANKKNIFVRIAVIFLREISRHTADLTFCISGSVCKAIGRWKNAHIVPNYVNTNHFKPKNVEKKHDLIYVGTLNRRKGIKYLIEAFKKVKRRKANASLLLVGKKYWDIDIPEIEGLNYKGPVSQEILPDRYNEARIFVTAALTEPFGIPIIEAQSCGLPIVATEQKAFYENTIPRKTSLLTPVKDPDAMAENIIYLLKNAKKQREMGKLGRKFVKERFETEKVLKSEITLITKFLGLR